MQGLVSGGNIRDWSVVVNTCRDWSVVVNTCRDWSVVVT